MCTSEVVSLIPGIPSNASDREKGNTELKLDKLRRKTLRDLLGYEGKGWVLGVEIDFFQDLHWESLKKTWRCRRATWRRHVASEVVMSLVAKTRSSGSHCAVGMASVRNQRMPPSREQVYPLTYDVGDWQWQAVTQVLGSLYSVLACRSYGDRGGS